MNNRDSTRAGARGSVLVPLVAAMLILLLTGFALAELFAAQRMQSVMEFETSQTVWIAEAGLWHAAVEGDEILTPVSYAGGDYTVTISGDVYTATSTWLDATRVVSRTLDPLATGGGSGPLNDAWTEASAYGKAVGKNFEFYVISNSSIDLVIESLELSADVASEDVKKFKLRNVEIWGDIPDYDGVPLPLGVTTLNGGTAADRTISPLPECPPIAKFDFIANAAPGTVVYTLVLHYTDGSSSTLDLEIAW